MTDRHHWHFSKEASTFFSSAFLIALVKGTPSGTFWGIQTDEEFSDLTNKSILTFLPPSDPSLILHQIYSSNSTLFTVAYCVQASKSHPINVLGLGPDVFARMLNSESWKKTCISINSSYPSLYSGFPHPTLSRCISTCVFLDSASACLLGRARYRRNRHCISWIRLCWDMTPATGYEKRAKSEFEDEHCPAKHLPQLRSLLHSCIKAGCLETGRCFFPLSPECS